MTLLFIMILPLWVGPWRLVEHQCGTNLVPLQDIFLKLKMCEAHSFYRGNLLQKYKDFKGDMYRQVRSADLFLPIIYSRWKLMGGCF